MDHLVRAISFEQVAFENRQENGSPGSLGHAASGRVLFPSLAKSFLGPLSGRLAKGVVHSVSRARLFVVVDCDPRPRAAPAL